LDSECVESKADALGVRLFHSEGSSNPKVPTGHPTGSLEAAEPVKGLVA
jgi:hypothetical protein